jgi:hypothetical protein
MVLILLRALITKVCIYKFNSTSPANRIIKLQKKYLLVDTLVKEGVLDVEDDIVNNALVEPFLQKNTISYLAHWSIRVATALTTFNRWQQRALAPVALM